MDCSPPGSSVHGIPRQEYWSGLLFPSPGDLPDLWIEPRPPALQADSLLTEPPGKPIFTIWATRKAPYTPLILSQTRLLETKITSSLIVYVINNSAHSLNWSFLSILHIAWTDLFSPYPRLLWVQITINMDIFTNKSDDYVTLKHHWKNQILSGFLFNCIQLKSSFLAQAVCQLFLNKISLISKSLPLLMISLFSWEWSKESYQINLTHLSNWQQLASADYSIQEDFSSSEMLLPLQFPGGSTIKHLPAMQERQETGVLSLGQEDALEDKMATHSSILARKIPWTEEPHGLRPWGRKEWDTTKQLSMSSFAVRTLLFSIVTTTGIQTRSFRIKGNKVQIPLLFPAACLWAS